MPKYSRRRSTYKRRKVYRRRTLGRKVKSLTRKVKKIQSNIETKKIDFKTTETLNIPAAGGAVQPHCKFLPIVAEGDDVADREGRQISAKTLTLRMLVYAGNTHADPGTWTTGTETDTAWTIRVMLVKILNSAPGPAAITLADLLQTNELNYNVMSPYNWDNRKKYKVLFDKNYNIPKPDYLGDLGVDGACVPGSSSSKKIITKRIKLNTKITYNGAGATAADCQQNGIYLLVWSDGSSNPLSNAGYQLRGIYNYRMTFQDL